MTPRRIRVAHVIETVWLGGVEQTRLALARGLDPERFEQILICTRAFGELPARFEEAGCAVRTVGAFQKRIDWAVICRVRSILRDFKPDIVHGGVFEGVTAAVIAGRLESIPVVLGEETSDPVGRRATGHLFFAALAMGCTRVVAVSSFVEDYLLKRLRLPRSKVVLVENGIVYTKPTTSSRIRDLRKRLGLTDDQFVIGTVSRLSEWHKRVGDAIRAVALLKERMPQLRLVIVGTGPDEEMLKALAESFEISDRVIFAGYQPETRPYFDCFDVFVHIPGSEAFGLVAAEAMMAGRPVIATRVGGLAGIVVDGETGTLVEAGNVAQIAFAIEEMAGDSDRRGAMGRAGRIRAEQHFSQDRYVRDIAKLYFSLSKAS